MLPPIIDKSNTAFTGTTCNIYFYCQHAVDLDNDKVDLRIINPETGKYTDQTDIVFYKQENSVNKYYIVANLNQSRVQAALKIKTTDSESAWSESVVFKQIKAPNLIIDNLSSNIETELGAEPLTISGIYESDQDNLKLYQLTLQNNLGAVLEKTELLYPVAPNNIYYTLSYSFEDQEDQEYFLIVDCLSQKGYSYSKSYKFKIAASLLNEDFELSNFNYTHLPMQGAIELKASITNNGDEQIAYIKTQRASYKDNYKKWETIRDVEHNIPNGSYSYSWVDKGMEAGIGYKYRFIAHGKDANGKIWKSAPLELDKVFFFNFEDILLSNSDLQLRIAFNPTISGLKYVNGESITNTLGGKYPIVRRNGQMNYRQFTIGGLISFYAEEGQELQSFDSTIDGYQNIENNSNSFFINSNFFHPDIKQHSLDDSVYIYEKLFRDKVIEFLYADDVKLFRSLPEGNMFVRLSNINLIPNQQLGRNIYSFTAQATEVGDNSLVNYYKFGFINNSEKHILVSDYVLLALDFTNGVAVINSDQLDEDSLLVITNETKQEV